MKADIKVHKPSGNLDGTKSSQFLKDIQKLIEEGATVVVIDFKDVNFMDSSGLGALVRSLKTVRAAGSKLLLCSLNEQIKMLLELTSMDKIFKIFESREELQKHINGD